VKNSNQPLPNQYPEISVKLDRNLDRLMLDILRRLTGQSQLTVLKCEPKSMFSQRLCTSGMTQYGTFEYINE
jgi:hypothetical protein